MASHAQDIASIYRLPAAERRSALGPVSERFASDVEKAMATAGLPPLHAKARAQLKTGFIQFFQAIAATYKSLENREDASYDTMLYVLMNPLSESLGLDNPRQRVPFAKVMQEALLQTLAPIKPLDANIEPLIRHSLAGELRSGMRYQADQLVRDVTLAASQLGYLGTRYHEMMATRQSAHNRFDRWLDVLNKRDPQFRNKNIEITPQMREEMHHAFDRYFDGFAVKIAMGEAYAVQHPGVPREHNKGYAAGRILIDGITRDVTEDLRINLPLRTSAGVLGPLSVMIRATVFTVIQEMKPVESDPKNPVIIRVDPRPPELPKEQRNPDTIMRLIMQELVPAADVKWRGLQGSGSDGLFQDLLRSSGSGVAEGRSPVEHSPGETLRPPPLPTPKPQTPTVRPLPRK